MAKSPSPNGQFQPGNKGGPGNPHARRTAQLRARLLDCITDDKLAEIVAGLVAAASAGDVAAAKLVLAYSVGPPLPAVSPDRLDDDEFAVMRSKPDPWQMSVLAERYSGL